MREGGPTLSRSLETARSLACGAGRLGVGVGPLPATGRPAAGGRLGGSGMAGDRSTPRRGGGSALDPGRCPAAAGCRQAPGRPCHSAGRRPATLVAALTACNGKRCGSRLAIHDRLTSRTGRTEWCGALGLRKPAVAASDRPRLSVAALGSRCPLAASGRLRRPSPLFVVSRRSSVDAPLRIDGEIIFPDGSAVNWRELWNALRAADRGTVLAKTMESVRLLDIASLPRVVEHT